MQDRAAEAATASRRSDADVIGDITVDVTDGGWRHGDVIVVEGDVDVCDDDEDDGHQHADVHERSTQQRQRTQLRR